MYSNFKKKQIKIAVKRVEKIMEGYNFGTEIEVEILNQIIRSKGCGLKLKEMDLVGSSGWQLLH